MPWTFTLDEKTRKTLNIPIADLPLSVLGLRCLQRAGIFYVGTLIQKSESEVLKERGFGRKSFYEVKGALAAMGLRLGTPLDNWKPPPCTLEELISRGLAKGSLTYAEVDAAMPDVLKPTDAMAAWLVEIKDRGVRLVKNAKNKTRTRTPRRDGLRSTVRRGSTSAARRQKAQLRELHTDACVAIGFDRAAAKKFPPPTIAFHFGLVEHGYEIHMFDEGKYVGAVCRDFSGNHPIDTLKESLVNAIEKAFKNWRAGL